MIYYIVFALVAICVFLVNCQGNLKVENFVPSNNETVGHGTMTMLGQEQEKYNAIFNEIVAQDKNKIDVSGVSNWQFQEHLIEQARILIQRIIDRINVVGTHHFYPLQTVSVRREVGVDPANAQQIEKYVIQMFIQEKYVQNVHAHVQLIGCTLYLRPVDNTMAIDKLHFVTDHYYKRPLVGGNDPFFSNYNYYRNPYHLAAPFYGSPHKVLFDDAEIDAVLQNTHKDLRSPKYRCFNEDGETSANTADSCDATLGYWDTKPTQNNECPFYKTNTNFPNAMGGLNNDGFCEMPIGTRRVGYRYISADPANKPYCYGCKVGGDSSASGPGSIGQCCDEQRDKELYPHLSSPDYAFPSDSFVRFGLRRELSERGINWSKYPTDTKNVLNKNQRNPVFNEIVGAGPLD